MVDQPSSALFRQLTGLTVKTESCSTVQVGRHLHIEPNCGIIAFDNSTCKSILDVIFGQLQAIHGAVPSLKGRQKLSLLDCWRRARRGSVKGCLYCVAGIGEAASR